MPVSKYKISFSKPKENVVWIYCSDSTWRCSSDSEPTVRYEKDFLDFLNSSIANGWKIDYGESM